MNDPDAARQKMVDNLHSKTGKDLEGWITHLRTTRLEKHGQIVNHLKKEQGMTHGYANLVAHYFRGLPTQQGADDGGLVESQYSGAKAELRPIYEALLSHVSGFGSDVEVAPKKAYVSLRRKTQFGLIQPSTKTRVDVGLKLKGVAPAGRLEASGSFNSMVSHRVRVTAPSDVDDELVGWLRDAYERAG